MWRRMTRYRLLIFMTSRLTHTRTECHDVFFYIYRYIFFELEYFWGQYSNKRRCRKLHWTLIRELFWNVSSVAKKLLRPHGLTRCKSVNDLDRLTPPPPPPPTYLPLKAGHSPAKGNLENFCGVNHTGQSWRHIWWVSVWPIQACSWPMYLT